MAEVYTNCSTVDNNGNLTVVGYCFGKLSIFGINVEVPVSSGFIVRLNPEGEMLWYKIIQSSVSSNIYSVGVDYSGNSYITGGINGISTFDTLVINATVSNAFVAKYDSAGNVLWVKQGLTSYASAGKDIWVDSIGNSCTIGNGGNISFDSLQILSSVFMVKINTNGEVNWLRDPAGITEVYSITTDNETNVIYSGTSPGPGTVRFPQMAKMDSIGNLLWIIENSAYQSSVDANKNILTISPGSGYPINYNIYLRKYGPNGYLINSYLMEALIMILEQIFVRIKTEIFLLLGNIPVVSNLGQILYLAMV